MNSNSKINNFTQCNKFYQFQNGKENVVYQMIKLKKCNFSGFGFMLLLMIKVFFKFDITNYLIYIEIGYLRILFPHH